MKQLRSIIKFLGGIEGLGVAGVLVAVYAVFIMNAPEVFTKPRIYTSFMETVPPQLIIGLGLTLVITAGEIDLSFPAVVALGGFVFASSYQNFDASWGPWAGLILAILVGAGVGFINGVIVAKIGVPSIMATLAAQFFWYGVTVLLADGKQIVLKGVRDERIYEVFVGGIDGILPDQRGVPVGLPAQAIWALGLTILIWFILNRHKFGEAVLFVGDNAEVARVMGINVDATRIQLFTLMGALAGFAGMMTTLVNFGVFFPTQGEGYLLPVIAAVFIGGTSFAGGRGVIVGTFFGAYIIGSLEAGVVASGIRGYWVQLVQGLVMAASVILNVLVGEGRLAEWTQQFRHWGIGLRRSVPNNTDQDASTGIPDLQET